MTMQLRDYQHECIEVIKENFKKSNAQLIQMPTGSGKTVTFLKYLSDHSEKSLILVPTRELVEQVEEASFNFMHESEVYAKLRGGMKLKKHNILTASSLNYDKTSEDLLQFGADTIVIDEAHRAQSKTYRKFVDKQIKINSNIKILGFTATPERHDHLPLLDIFGKLTFKRNIYDLIKLGHLCDMESFRIKTGQKFDTRRLSGNDFSTLSLNELDNESRNNLVLKTYLQNCKNKKTLIFCVSVDHAKTLAKLFTENGVDAQAIYGNLPYNQRKYILNSFKSGKTKVLLNCQLLTEGFDEPSIDALIIARPTKSKSLYCQMVGRGLRNFPGKSVCSLYELTDNVHNICTFNVAAEKDAIFNYTYKDGIRLSELKETLDKITLHDLEIYKERLQLFITKNEYLHTQQATEHQINELQKLKLFYIEPISFLEASFILWKHKLKEKYAFNNRA